MKRPFRTVSILGLLLCCGCSSFNRDWNRAANQSVNEGTVVGAWEGSWMSDSNHHHGPLRCIMSREDDSHYEARFRAGYLGFFRFSYTAHLEFQPHDIGWE